MPGKALPSSPILLSLLPHQRQFQLWVLFLESADPNGWGFSSIGSPVCHWDWLRLRVSHRQIYRLAGHDGEEPQFSGLPVLGWANALRVDGGCLGGDIEVLKKKKSLVGQGNEMRWDGKGITVADIHPSLHGLKNRKTQFGPTTMARNNRKFALQKVIIISQQKHCVSQGSLLWVSLLSF